jgi:hypothetical protein
MSQVKYNRILIIYCPLTIIAHNVCYRAVPVVTPSNDWHTGTNLVVSHVLEVRLRVVCK